MNKSNSEGQARNFHYRIDRTHMNTGLDRQVCFSAVARRLNRVWRSRWWTTSGLMSAVNVCRGFQP